MGFSNGDILVYSGTQWLSQKSMAGPFNIDSPTFYVDSTNHRIGIGTTAPSDKLDVMGGAAVDSGIAVKMGSIANLRLTHNDSPAQTFIVRTDSDRKFKVIDETAQGTPTRLAIDTSGNLGIGTASPNSRLHVAGAVARAVRTIYANYSYIQDSDSVVLVDTSNLSIGMLIYLPGASTTGGRQYTIMRVAGTQTAGISCDYEHIDGQTYYSVLSPLTIVSNGVNGWNVVVP
jgi:hypothetical protein